MKNRFLALIFEAASVNFLAVFFIWKLYVMPGAGSGNADILSIAAGSIRIMTVVYVAAMAAVAVQGYFWIVKPYSLKLQQMEKAIEESKTSEAIRKEFVANVSHELKTPLTSISGFIETLQDGAAEDPEIRTKFIDIIAIETARLKRLIQDLLVLSDIENKRSTECDMFNVSAAVADTLETLDPIAERKNIEIITDMDLSAEISGSADRFRQMMVNLVENAIKYSDENSHVWVKVCDENDKIIVSVRDEGIGIAPEHHDRLFERFYRVDKSRSKKAGGTGLGLSIVKHIAVLFGAALKVESQVGKGTTFFVIFDREETDIS